MCPLRHLFPLKTDCLPTQKSQGRTSGEPKKWRSRIGWNRARGGAKTQRLSPFGLHPQKKGSVLQARVGSYLFLRQRPIFFFFLGQAKAVSHPPPAPPRAPCQKINQAQSSGGPIFDEQSGVIMLSPGPRNQEPGGSAFIPCCPVAWTLVSRADQPRKRPAVGSSPPLFVALLGDRSGSSCSAKGPAHDGAHPLSSVNR